MWYFHLTLTTSPSPLTYHEQEIKDGTAPSQDPVPDTPVDTGDGEGEEDDIELPQAVTQVASAAASFVKGFW